MRITRARVIARTAVLAMAVMIIAGLCAIAPVATQTARAETGSDFQAGYVLSDANMNDYNSMSAATIQAFLASKEAGCTPGNRLPCLMNYSQATASRAANSHCAAYTGSASESAATIIYKVAQACYISPKVLIVLLQKEQGIVTSVAPSQSMYNAATGYACPDTSGCDTAYYGFYNQVYMAAWQFQSYAAGGSSWRYHVGTVSIQWSPNAACGASNVTIADQATADLYNYTPYQPNAAALANLNGIGNSCSSYGNRNFWSYFWSWFGDPTGNSNPFGVIDSITGGPQSIVAQGWIIDPDSTAPVNVHVYIDGVFNEQISANVARPDVATVFPQSGDDHGFDVTVVGQTPGPHQVCLYGINISFGGNMLLGCRNVLVPTGNPFGVIDTASATPTAISVSGWAIDPDVADPISATVTDATTGATQTVTAGGDKAGLSAVFPAYGDDHDYSASIPITTGGIHLVCVQPLNVGPGSNGAPFCQNVVVPTGPPLGVIDTMTAAPGSVSIMGWMLDPDSVSPISVLVSVDGVAKAQLTASSNKTGLDAVFPGYGDDHDYSTMITGLSTGQHTVCVTGQNVGPGKNTAVCSSIRMPTGNPTGVIDSTASAFGTITVSGWMIDPDTIAPIQVQVYVSGVLSTTLAASGLKSGLDDAFPGYGNDHDFSGAVTGVGNGVQKLCIVGINVGGGQNSAPICTSVQMPTGPPFGVIDAVTPQTGGFSVTGWAIDPDVSTPVTVDIKADGVDAGSLLANGVKSGLDSVFPGYGDDHDYLGSFNGLTAGSHQICAYADDVQTASVQAFLGCATVLVT